MNPHLDDATWWLTFGSFVLALVALAANFWAGVVAVVEVRRVYRTVAVLNTVYVAGYVWLLFGHVNPGTWSNWLRPVGIMAWPLVWAYPAFVAVRLSLRLQRRAREFEAR